MTSSTDHDLFHSQSDEPIVVSLYDHSGVMVQPWADAGFKCFCIDIDHSIRRDRVEGNITFTWGDARSWFPPSKPGIIFAFPTCTDVATSGARDFRKKQWPLLRDGMDLFWSALMAARWAGCPYMIENPVGRISGIYQQPSEIVQPCDFGDPYTKSTCLWTGGGIRFSSQKKSLSQ
jgi:hypothetical protein